MSGLLMLKIKMNRDKIVGALIAQIRNFIRDEETLARFIMEQDIFINAVMYVLEDENPDAIAEIHDPIVDNIIAEWYLMVKGNLVSSISIILLDQNKDCLTTETSSYA